MKSLKYPLAIYIGFLLVLAIIAGWHYAYPKKEEQVACTMEAKLCPDGSYVARTGPNCEFAACPGGGSPTGGGIVLPSGALSFITGVVLLGPTCPVVRNPPDPQCADKPFQTNLVLTTVGGTKIIKTFSSKASGKFTVQVPPGTYEIHPAANSPMLPRCNVVDNILVHYGLPTNVTVSCDTGIR